MKPLTLGFSPCPNDTFVFHALVHGEADSAHLSFEPRLRDVETLNRLAVAGELDVAKVSYGALPYLIDDYFVLRTGGALGRGCGPLVVARESFDPDRLGEAIIGIPGRMTTANLLLRLFAPTAPPGRELEYRQIMPAVEAGEVEAGLIIHESRFTYRDHGLKQVVDLGAWWEVATGTPVPLGAIVARRELGATVLEIERLIRRSVEAALKFPERSEPYVRAHAAELSDDVIRQHIELYVNRHTVELGADGESAVHELMDRAFHAGLLSSEIGDPFPGKSPFAGRRTPG